MSMARLLSAHGARPHTPGPRLARLADVRPPSRGHELDDLAPAGGARLAEAIVHQELVLEGPVHPVGVAEVVDGRAACVDPGLEYGDDLADQLVPLRARELAHRSQRMDPRAEQ